ncbi:MAG TPA: acetyl/propionyl/methylcrotonyl-CoA carboxylase subunit alpha [Thermoleophilia bacterium]|nr:acetyl/propionyl/methylcrotonyl-CoA carboxylase subunit alpha [Thermoleophilia bacterium]
MFNTILIANRGEIACRVMKTARRMGIRTVAVFSDEDKDALHVQMADEAVNIGSAPSSESYLVIERIVNACLETGAEAVHPGYGFLSENPAFATALSERGIVFIGPDAGALETMGDKLASKKLAIQAGVPPIPGCAEAVKSGDDATDIAEQLGYPVILKAAAGGGGKGMRVARTDAECREGLERASSEALKSFGDDRVFVEKYVSQPRHIEIQIIADSYGNCVHLGERECSLQRRHQKVIEEAPSPFVDEDLRRRMGADAVKLARAVGYSSVGTVEFIVDSARNYYFLEMNTRLQVEHPVTEFVTGLDLVELMIRVAAGEPLPFGQDEVHVSGWAIEARVYAEDPLRGFVPSSGRLVHFMVPEENEHVRVDTGVYEGGEVSPYYDPMMAKLITRGATRQEAIDRMNDALDELYIRGVSHNIGFLSAVMAHPRFIEGRLSTTFIDEEYPEGFRAEDIPHNSVSLLVTVAATMHRRYMERSYQISGRTPGLAQAVRDDWVVVMGGVEYPVVVRIEGDLYSVVLNGERHVIQSAWSFGNPFFRCVFDGQELCLQVHRDNLVYRISHRGARVGARVMTPRAAELNRLIVHKPIPVRSNVVSTPMPGLLVRVSVAVGQEVDAGQELAIVEAMKMENIIRAKRDGTITAVLAEPGQALCVDQAILQLE